MNVYEARILARKILERPLGHDWTLRGHRQILRLYLAPDKRYCLHVFETNPDAPPEAHSHGVTFVSYVLAGRVSQHRYVPPGPGVEGEARNYRFAVSGSWVTPDRAEETPLVELPLEAYVAGQSYASTADEIHRSLFETGAVTLLRWNDDHAAKVANASYWLDEWREKGDPWDAGVGVPTDEDILRIAGAALDAWDSFPVAQR